MKKLFKLALVMAIVFGSFFTAKADEGMWLPSVISHTRLKDMQSKGFKLTAEDIYNVNQASLKDAIVSLGGCTGELISDKGLFLTNHHCGFGQIQFHSSIENDYLTNGFSAMSLSEELPSNNYSASFLKKMEDVTSQVMKGITEGMSEEQQSKIKKENIKLIVDGISKANGYRATVEPLFYTNQYFLFVYQRYDDIRLVVAPPSAIGKFGGETDNWMWPRHTGDFTMFRIYADKDNNPAKYSKDNVPYTPKRSLTISLKGVNEGDFTLIYGYPGKTNEYLHSEAVKYIAQKSNPHKISLRTYRLDRMIENMEKSDLIRIKYAAKKASAANAWKKWQGESRGVEMLKTVDKKIAFEKDFQKWADKTSKYTNLLSQLKGQYIELEQYAFANDYYTEAYNAIELPKFAGTFASKDVNAFTKNMDKIKSDAELFFKNYETVIDIPIAKEMMKRYLKNLPANFIPEILTQNADNIDAWIDNLFESSIFSSQNRVNELLSKTPEEIVAAVAQDPAVKVYKEFTKLKGDKITPQFTKINNQITALYKDYMKGMMEMQPNKEFYPDANSTLRVAYGKVSGANPADGVVYKHYTTLEGIIEKDNPAIYDYNIPQKLRDIYNSKDYGQWEMNGTVPVCFIASNHTTGGNSGSPILNDKGELIGLNFDRMWESTMSDIVFDEDMCRNIAVDVRYVLFLMDKVCGAGYLLDEMKFSK